MYSRLDKLRAKLEREVNAQKPKLESIKQNKEELSKRLAICASKENELSSNIELAMRDIENDDMKQIVSDAMRMKQLEVNYIQHVFSNEFITNFLFFFIKVALQEVKDQNLSLTKSLQLRSEESEKSELLILQLMRTAKSLYLTLRSHDSVPTYMEADFNVSYLCNHIHYGSSNISVILSECWSRP